ncbi:hypothetical protein BD770DRAFT_385634 [Pilaira anomala]|nr:hypothetical protein BD770DRAFT_385634 [Pilaira anomala]
MKVKRSATRKTGTIKNKQRAEKETETAEIVVERPITNPASKAKLDLYLGKRAELEAISQVKQKSNELRKSWKELNESVKILTDSTKNVSDILANWEGAFSIMGVSNVGEMKTTHKWVRFVRPSDKESTESIGEKRR